MIMGVDHIILSSNDVGSAIQNCEAQGFKTVFHEKNLLNHSSKQKFVSDYTAEHDIVFLEDAQNHFAVEVIKHVSQLDPSPGPYSLKDGRVILASHNPVAEREFLTGALGFKPKEDKLALSSPIPKWACVLELNQVSKPIEYQLDGVGFTCL